VPAEIQKKSSYPGFNCTILVHPITYCTFTVHFNQGNLRFKIKAMGLAYD